VIGATQFKRMPFLAAVKEAKMRRFVAPGERLDLVATLVHEGSGYAVTDAKGTVDGKPVCGAQITFRVVDFPRPELRSHMETAAKTLGFPLGVHVDG
jgi:3-hydroxyacyl-[acyl-carrier-protein] dehydratase